MLDLKFASLDSLIVVLWAFLNLGCTAFGGPIAHLGFFRKEFVEKRLWIDDAGDVFLKFVVVLRFNEVLPAFDREHDMEINLRAGICHEPKMPLLTELENLFSFGSTKISRLRRSVRTIRAKSCAIVRLVFDRRDVMESSHFKLIVVFAR